MAAEAPLIPPNRGRRNARETQEPEPWYAQLSGMIFRMMIIYFIINMFKGFTTNNNTKVPIAETPSDQTGSSTSENINAGISLKSQYVKPIWNFGDKLHLKVYVNEEKEIKDLSTAKPFWISETITFGDDKFDQRINGKYKLTKNSQNNGTIYAHIYLVKEGNNINSEEQKSDNYGFLVKRKELSRYYPLKKAVKKKKLINGEIEVEEKEVKADEFKSDQGSTITKLLGKSEGPIVAHWHNNFTINLVNIEKKVQLAALPPPILEKIDFLPAKFDELGNPLPLDEIYPILFLNDFWVLRENLYPINDTLSELPLNIDFNPLSLWKFYLLVGTDAQFKNQLAIMGADSSELDLIKSTLMDTNPWLLGITMIVSLLHSLFDFLAFKNDIAFWNNKKDVIGISVRTLVMNIIFQVIIFLYLLDNSENTSWMVLISNAISIIIEIWKIKKALNAKLIRSNDGFWPYKLEFIEKENTELEKKTDEYDQMAYTYLSYIAYPLLAAYAIYSVYYEEHKSWYSFIINTAVGFVYTFGFITMTPQLFINYKLKSVAHMPWKTLMYKSLNTFIDDLFAFIIKMPTLHRLACLRDDVVFIVYIYQRWIYPEDHTRANEFGQVGTVEPIDHLEDKKEKIEEKKESKKNQ